MAISQPHTHTTSVLAEIEHVLTSEANRIGSDIHKATLHTSPWLDLIKQSTFPEGMGYQLSTLIYDRALPVGARAADTHLGTGSEQVIGPAWTSLVANTHATDGSAIGHVGGSALDTRGEDNARIDFTRKLKNYALDKAVIESPRINVEDLRFAAHRTEQLRAIMDLLKESTRHSWEERYRDEYARLCDNIVICKSSGTAVASGKEGSTTPVSGGDLSTGGTNIDQITANVSNKILDDIYFKLIRAGAGASAYGRENGRPVFSLVLSSEASYQLMTEAGFRDDVRYNNAKVSDLIAPLGVEKSFRGFYHLCDDMAPRYNLAADGSDLLVREYPFKHNDTLDTVVVNPDYDSAPFEEAFVLVDNVMESLIPAPISGGGGMKFAPVNYKGDFKWTNIPDVSYNPDGTIGFFRGIMASASKPIKTEFGYSVVFKRTSTTPAE